MSNRPSPRALPFTVPGATVLVLLVAACSGCAGPKTDPLVQKSRAVFREVMESDPQYTRYALDVASRSSAPFAREVIEGSLTSSNYQLATQAVRAAGLQRLETARETLRDIVQNKEGVLRLEAAIALARMGDEEAMRVVESQIVDASGRPNATIAIFLVESGREDLVRPALEKAMQSEEQAQRDQVYAILGQIRQPWATELLVRGLEKEFGEGRKEAIVALGRTGDPSVAKYIRRFLNTRGLVFASIEALGNLGDEESLQSLRKLAQGSGEKLVQVYAGAATWKLGDGATALAVLGPLVVDDDPVVRLNLAEQLGSVPSENVFPMLGTLTEDKDPAVRIAALRALRERADPALQEILLGCVEDPEYQAAVLAIDALGAVGLPTTVPALEPLLASDNGYVAMSAANAILEIKAREAAALAEKPA